MKCQLQRKPFIIFSTTKNSIDSFTDSINDDRFSSTIDTHSSLVSLSTQSPYLPSSFDYSNPVYYDETDDCKNKLGFHRDEFDSDCRKFYLCKLELNTGRFMILQFECVPGQVFDLDSKVCVYEEMSNNSCFNSLNNKEIHLKDNNSSLTYSNEQNGENFKNELQNSTDSSFTELKPNRRLNSEAESTEKPVNNQDSNSFENSSSVKPDLYLLNHGELSNLAGSNSNLRIRVRPVISSNRFNEIQQQHHKSQSSTNILLNSHNFLPYSPYSTYYNPLFAPAQQNSFLLNQHYYPFGNPSLFSSAYPLKK